MHWVRRHNRYAERQIDTEMHNALLRVTSIVFVFVTQCQEDEMQVYTQETRMLANAQRDGRPAEHRWCLLFNSAKSGWRPLLYAVQSRCQEAKPVEICRGAQTPETISGVSGLTFTILWGHVEDILLLSNFPIVDMCLSCEDTARQSCAMVPRWRFLATFCVLYFQRAACSTFQTCILNSH